MQTSKPRKEATPFEQRLHAFQRVTASLIMVGGLVVIVGWFLKNAQLTQLNPQFAPMQFNTAVGFVACGLALYLVVDPRLRSKAPAPGVFLVLLGGCTLLQYLLRIDLGIDNLVVEPFTTVRTSHPGRMAPNTAIAFLLFGLSCTLIARGRLGAGICLSGGVVALGAISAMGYVSGVEAAYGWGDLTRMALHTSFGFLMVGTGVIGILASSEARSLSNPGFLGLCIGLFGVVCSIAVWQALLADQGSQLRLRLGLHADRIANGMSLRLEETIHALERLAERSVEGGTGAEAKRRWERDARRYLDDFDTLGRIFWMSDSDGAIWAEDRERGGTLDDPSSQMSPVARDVRAAGLENSVVLYLWEQTPRHLSIGIGVTGATDQRGILCADLDMSHFAEPLLGRMAGEVDLQLHLGERLVYQTSGLDGDAGTVVFSTDTPISTRGGDLRITLGANEVFVRNRDSKTAWVVLLGGFTITGLLVVAVLFAAVSWRARELYKVQYSQYQLVTDSVPAMIAVFDSQEHVVFVNSRLRMWLGSAMQSNKRVASVAEMIGVAYEQVRDYIQQALAGETVRFEIPVSVPGTGERVVDLQFVPHTGPNGEVDQVFALILDVTEEIQAREELRSTAERLQRFSSLATGRELRMLELKREVNTLLGRLGEESRYHIPSLKDTAGRVETHG